MTILTGSGSGNIDTLIYVLIGVGAALAVLLAIAVIIAVTISRKNKKKIAELQELNKNAKTENVVISNGVRYTQNNMTFRDDGTEAITHRMGDITLERGITYTARVGGRLMPGKYTVLSGVEGVNTFNMRLGGIVREIKHGSDIIISEDEEICAVSHSAVLR